jgi:hypothetical protein
VQEIIAIVRQVGRVAARARQSHGG